MKTLLSSALVLSMFVLPSMAIEPLSGSITADGPTRSTLQEAPVGSVAFHRLYDKGNHYEEIYVVGPDGRLNLVDRKLLQSG